jgi:hypothetical protein
VWLDGVQVTSASTGPYVTLDAAGGTHTVEAFPATSVTSVGGSVPATLSLTLGAPASFGALLPGVAKTYTASTTATVTSTAGDAALSWTTPTLRNGAFALASPVAVTPEHTAWSGPVSNDTFGVAFSQTVGANDALRTGSYSANVTFTLSTTHP